MLLQSNICCIYYIPEISEFVGLGLVYVAYAISPFLQIPTDTNSFQRQENLINIYQKDKTAEKSGG